MRILKMRLPLFLQIIKLVLLVFTTNGLAKSTDESSIICPKLKCKCEESPEERLTVMVELEPLDTSRYGLLQTDQDALVEYLKLYSARAQRPVISTLKKMRSAEHIGIKSFWIANRLALKNFSCDSLSEISQVADIAEVREAVKMHIHSFGEQEVVDPSTLLSTVTTEALTPGTPWGVQLLRASEVWPQIANSRREVVVANIDTGVRGTHEALRDNWRGGHYSWYDAYLDTTEGVPYDVHGHGTHTMGTICGRKNNIGVCPQAKWMACIGCDYKGSCSEETLLVCGQWVACPYSYVTEKEECGLRPQVVSNSWGDGRGNKFYNEVIRNWNKMGILNVFSIGNSGPNCRTANSPGDQDGVIAVGATTVDDTIARFSSVGPSQTHGGPKPVIPGPAAGEGARTKPGESPHGTGRTKPDVSAPGVQILSSYNASDTAYVSWSGTSMACPHVSGTVALLFFKVQKLTFHQVLGALAYKITVPPHDKKCDSDPGKENVPNNVFGIGRIDALNTFEAVLPFKPPQ